MQVFVYEGDIGGVSSRRIGYTGDIETSGLPLGLVWLSGSGAPIDGAAGTGVGEAEKGSLYTDEGTGIPYVNLGTISNVEWHGFLLA